MQKFYIAPTKNTPEINFSAAENHFVIKGHSAPEDVRSLYYPVIEWIKIFADDVIEGEYPMYNASNSVRFRTDLEYFNSSSAKFLFDIFTELKRLADKGFPVIIEWYFDSEDPDQKEAGTDISLLVEMEFTYVPRTRKQ
jgi:hypothetical protein